MVWEKLRILYLLPSLIALAIVWDLQWNILASANHESLDVNQQYASDDVDVLNGDAGDDELGLLGYVTSIIDLGPVAPNTTFDLSNRSYKNLASQSRAPPKSH